MGSKVNRYLTVWKQLRNWVLGRGWDSSEENGGKSLCCYERSRKGDSGEERRAADEVLYA